MVVLLVACGSGSSDPGDGGPDAGPGPDAAPVDPSDELFRPDHILEITIAMAAADWEALRHEPEQIGMPDATCADPLVAEAYTTFPADITIDGETVTQVGVRKKGNLGSLSTERPGLKVKANQYVDQRIFGLHHLTLNNNKQDDTLISQCLGYGLFAAAGVPAPRCSFAHVTVNGEDLGIYSNVETVKRNFLGRHFADDGGNLYESGGDFSPGQTGGFQPKSDTVDCGDLEAVVAAMGAPDDQLASELGAVVDLDAFLTFWAMEVITDHWDGYANNRNNYYLYHDPTSGRMHFIPWGIDDLFSGRQRTTRPYSVFACGAMPWRLYDVAGTRALYLDRLRQLLDTVWDETAILAEIDRMEALLTPLADPSASGVFAGELEGVRGFVTSRAAQLLGELDAGDPIWPYPAGEASCRIRLGTLTATFDTPWDSLDTWGVGTGTMGGDVAGVDLTSATLYANAGLSGEGQAVIQMFAPLPDGRYAVVFVLVQDPANLVPGNHAVDLANVAAIMTFYDPVTDSTSGGGLILPGQLVLDSASTIPGAPIAGSITGDVIEL